MSEEETTTAETTTESTPAMAPETATEHAGDAPTESEHDDVRTDDGTERGTDPRPLIVLTAICDSNARMANLTLSHADAYERAQKATAGRDIAGLAIVELSVQPRAFIALRDHTARPEDTVAVYDLFPLAAHLDSATRRVAGQFLAAEILWALEEQGVLQGVPLNIRLDVPRKWGDRSPKAVHEKLLEAGALDLTEAAIETFKTIKGQWDGVS